MWFWWFILICDCVIPITMILGGRIMWKHCPNQINGMVGYRTKRSMKNMDTWKFAHDYVGKLWWKIGWIMLAPTILVHLPFWGATDNTIGFLCIIIMIVQSIFFIGSIFLTEKALKENFDENGVKR